jgi:hypothetical protein
MESLKGKTICLGCHSNQVNALEFGPLTANIFLFCLPMKERSFSISLPHSLSLFLSHTHTHTHTHTHSREGSEGRGRGWGGGASSAESRSTAQNTQAAMDSREADDGMWVPVPTTEEGQVLAGFPPTSHCTERAVISLMLWKERLGLGRTNKRQIQYAHSQENRLVCRRLQDSIIPGHQRREPAGPGKPRYSRDGASKLPELRSS